MRHVCHPDVGESRRPFRALLVNGCVDWPGALRLPRMLRQAGARVTLLAPPRSRVRGSRFVDEFVPAAACARAFADATFAHVAAAGPAGYDWVILANEPTALAVLTHPLATSVDWLPVAPDAGAIDRALHKGAFLSACAAAGVPVPASVTVTDLAAASAAAAVTGYPLILKPTEGWAGGGVRRVDAAAGLAAAFADVAGHVPLVVQAYVTGQAGATHVLFDRGVPRAWASYEKTECWPKPYGPAVVRTPVDDPQIEPLVRGVGRVTGFHGLCGLDWLRDARDGTYRAIEFNPRPTPAVDMARGAGVDFARAMRELMAGGTPPDRCQRPRLPGGRGRAVYMFPNHVTTALATRDYAGLLKWLPLAARHDAHWHEPRILWGDARSVARQLVGFARGEARRATHHARQRAKSMLGVARRPAPAAPGA